MKIQIASDLHLEFSDNKRFIKSNPILPCGEILLLGGDILPFIEINKNNDFFNYVSDNFKETYWIAGNHEYYGFDLDLKKGSFKELIKNNVTLLNNTTIIYEGIRLIMSTLWSRISEINEWDIERGMNDFRAIRYQGKRFTVEQFNLQHEMCRNYIESALAQNEDKKSIIMTHHVPTFLNYPEQYRHSVLNEAFAVECYELIDIHQPDYWIYGHHHSPITEFQIGKTKLINNQLGYVAYGEHRNFKTDFVIDI